jgi:hypothetical protein
MPRKCERVCLVQGPFAVAPRWGAGASIHSMGLLPLQFGASHLAFSASRCLGLELTSVKNPFTQLKKTRIVRFKQTNSLQNHRAMLDVAPLLPPLFTFPSAPCGTLHPVPAPPTLPTRLPSRGDVRTGSASVPRRPAGYTGDGSRADSGIPPAATHSLSRS